MYYCCILSDFFRKSHLNFPKDFLILLLIKFTQQSRSKCYFCIQLSDINKHPWVTAGGKGELELELPMMEVVQTHVLPSIEAVDPDVLQAICSLGCFKEREKLIQHLLSPRYRNSHFLLGPMSLKCLFSVTIRRR